MERTLSQVPGGDRAEFFPMPEIGISSTLLRERARAAQPTTFLVPDQVRSYIDQHRLYRAEPGAAEQDRVSHDA
ncbi:MAG: hypothetical protein JO244_10300 [Solirubrobacterales bacterium]|nr:hypothetical protein [Solirubrobacterales bacterium]